MKITRHDPEPPRPTYTLEMDYTELHGLYHTLLDRSRGVYLRGISDVERRLFAALKEHA